MQNRLGMLLAAISFANAYAHYNKQSIVFFLFLNTFYRFISLINLKLKDNPI